MLVNICVISEYAAVQAQYDVHDVLGGAVLMQAVQLIAAGRKEQAGGVLHLIHILYVSHTGKYAQGTVSRYHRQ